MGIRAHGLLATLHLSGAGDRDAQAARSRAGKPMVNGVTRKMKATWKRAAESLVFPGHAHPA